MQILALDLSLTRTGWANYYVSGVLDTAKLRGLDRLAHIRAEVLKSIRENPVELVVLEGYSYGSKGRAVVNLGELGGVIRLALHDEGMPFVEVPPAVLKKYATGRGNAPKEEVLAAAIRRIRFGGHDHNQADASWLLTMALDWYGQLDESPVPKAQRDVLTKVEWPKLEHRKVA